MARGLGFTQVKNNKEYVRWETINSMLEEMGYIEFSQQVGKEDFIPENIFYRLAMKAKNETAIAFQALIADEILPTLRRIGKYEIRKESTMSKEELDYKKQELEIRKQELELKSKEFKSNMLKEMAIKYSHLNNVGQVLDSKAIEIVTGEKLLPLPKLEEKTYSATDLANKFSIELGIVVSKNLIGKLANKYNLKTKDYSVLVLDKAQHSDKIVETYRYKENSFDIFREALRGYYNSKFIKGDK